MVTDGEIVLPGIIVLSILFNFLLYSSSLRSIDGCLVVTSMVALSRLNGKFGSDLSVHLIELHMGLRYTGGEAWR